MSIMITTLFVFTCIRQSTYYCDPNNWLFVPKVYSWTSM